VWEFRKFEPFQYVTLGKQNNIKELKISDMFRSPSNTLILRRFRNFPYFEPYDVILPPKTDKRFENIQKFQLLYSKIFHKITPSMFSEFWNIISMKNVEKSIKIHSKKLWMVPKNLKHGSSNIFRKMINYSEKFHLLSVPDYSQKKL